MHLWKERILSVELSGGEKGLVGGSDPAVEVDMDDSMDRRERGSARAEAILRFNVERKPKGGNDESE